MRKCIVVALIALFWAQQAFCAYEVADKGKQLFPDDEIILTSSKLTIDIQKNWTEKAIVANKIFDENFISLRKNATGEYPIFYGGTSEISIIKAFHPTVVKDIVHRQEGIFHDDSRIKLCKLNFYSYAQSASIFATKRYTDMRYITSVYFNNFVPCLEREIEIRIPEGVDLDIIEKNFDGYTIARSEKIVGKEKIITYSVRNIDNFSDEDDTPGMSYIYPHLLIRIKSFVYKKEKVTLFGDLNDLYTWYKSLVRQIDNHSDTLTSLVSELTGSASTDEEKIKNIFYWVQDNIRYIAFEDGIAGFKPESCQNVYANKYGDCKGMANLTKEMLKLAGFDARLTWIGTRHIAYDYSTPSLACDNHMICALKQGEDFIYLDATEKYINLGEYAERIQGQQVLIENGDFYILKKVPTQKHTQNLRKIELSLTATSETELEGKVKMKFVGEQRSSIQGFMTSVNSTKKEDVEKRIATNLDKNITAEITKSIHNEYGQKEVELESNLYLKNYVSSFEGDMYVYINPYKFYEDKAFKDRENDYWFSEKRHDIVDVKFTVPAGKKVTDIPKAFSAENEEFIIKFNCSQSGKEILYNLEIEIPKAEITKKNFEEWNAAIKKLKDTYEYPIILQNI